MKSLAISIELFIDGRASSRTRPNNDKVMKSGCTTATISNGKLGRENFEGLVGAFKPGPRDWTPREPEQIEELRRRIEKAVRSADLAFWKEIAKAFPEAPSGDFYAEGAHAWNKAVAQAVYSWLQWNHPRPYWIETIARK